MLLEAERAHGGTVTIVGAAPEVAAVLALVRPASVAPKPTIATAEWVDFPRLALKTITDDLAYVGEVLVAFVRLPARLRML